MKPSTISTEHQPKGSGKNPSDTLDKGAVADSPVPPAPATTGGAPVVDEKGRPLDGDGLTR